jgi:hypothetical protein
MLPWTVLVACVGQPALPAGWVGLSGDGWRALPEPRGGLLQSAPAGEAIAVSPASEGTLGAWRCTVEPGMRPGACGIRFAASPDGGRGYAFELGVPGSGGLRLLGADGAVLWQDEWAPRVAYGACILEGVVEPGRIRAQMASADGRVLLSQSDWIDVPDGPREGVLGVYTRDGAARFWAPLHAAEPLFEVTQDAPNRRRLAQGPDSPWVIAGQGNWMWMDEQRTRVRQYANADRAWAINRAVHATAGAWQSAVRVHPGAGGAGMVIGTNEQGSEGYLCWLGGTFGAGCLMLYRLTGPFGPSEQIWAGASDKWHYDEDLTVRAETRDGTVRVRLLAADGTTIDESPWLDASAHPVAADGYIGFHTWLGNAEFWGFAGEAGAAAPAAGTSALGAAWLEQGGVWALEEDTLRQTAADRTARILRTDVTGTKGLWSARVVRQDEGVAGILAQVSPQLDAGFELLIGPGGVTLTDLTRPAEPRWQAADANPAVGVPYVLEVRVVTDRVSVRVLAEDGSVLAESPSLYISDKNNDRVGHLGFATRGTRAAFTGWSLKPE